MRRIIAVASAIATVAGAGVAGAQSRWSIEASGGAAFATEKIGGADLGTGIGLEVNGRYRIMPHLAVYGGWDWHHFPVEQPPPGGDMDIEDTGYAFGFRFEHPLAGRTAGWLRVGGIANHIELENADGDIVSDSGHGLGWEAGAGLAVPIGDRVRLTPGARYRALSRDVEMGGVTAAVDLRYVTLGMGIAYAF
jgi:opacity protein-like surface antigen